MTRIFIGWLAWLLAAIAVLIACLFGDSFRCARVLNRYEVRAVGMERVCGHQCLVSSKGGLGISFDESRDVFGSLEELDAVVAETKAVCKDRTIRFVTFPAPAYPFSGVGKNSIWKRCGLQFQTTKFDATGERNWSCTTVCPYWLMLLAAVPAPSIVFARRIRANLRAQRGYCRFCGYDLRESPDQCPECGGARRKSAGKGKRGYGHI